MTNKPVWIICSKEWAEKVRQSFAIGCPPPVAGKSCPERDGEVMTCNECWNQYVDFDIVDEEGDAK